uniref:Tyrosine specific protein phosphatases domain-containing protein n=1 Tax=Grammatophora oceanica TaxID=210454 RepID=A0A7S1VK86_9STRA
MRCSSKALLFLLVAVVGNGRLMVTPFTIQRAVSHQHHQRVNKRQKILQHSSSVEDMTTSSAEAAKAEAEFQTTTRSLCEERNLSLEKVKNGRDLASPIGSPVKPNRMIRIGRLGAATPKDMDLLFNKLGIQTIVDLRSPTELKEDESLQRSEVFSDFYNVLWTERGRKRDGCLRELGVLASPLRSRWWKSKSDTDITGSDEQEDEEIVKEVINLVEESNCNECDEVGGVSAAEFLAKAPSRKERHFVSLMNEFKYVRGTMSRVRKRDIARTIIKAPGALVSRRVRASVKKPFLDRINDGGLLMVNELLLRYGAPGIKYVLELCSDKSRHPIAFHCTAGKDRTGVITAIVLSLLGVPDESIVEDYSMSANVYAEMNDHSAMVGALSQRNLNPKTFLGAPPQVMRDTLQSIREDYGGVEGYLTEIGFGPEKQVQLKKALTE